MAGVVFGAGISPAFRFGNVGVRANPPPAGNGAIPIPMSVDVNHNFHGRGPPVPMATPQFNHPRTNFLSDGGDGYPRCHISLPILQNNNQGKLSITQRRLGAADEKSYTILASDFRLHGGSLTFIRGRQQEQKLAPPFYDGLSLSALNYWLHTPEGIAAYDPDKPDSKLRLLDEIPLYGLLVSELTDHRKGDVLGMAFAVSHHSNGIPNVWLHRTYSKNELGDDSFGIDSYLWLRIETHKDQLPPNSAGFVPRKYLRLTPYCTNSRAQSLHEHNRYSIYVGRPVNASGDGRSGLVYGDARQSFACRDLAKGLYPMHPTLEYQKVLNALPRVEIMLSSSMSD